VKFYAAVASISVGSPSFILLATDILAKRRIPQSYHPSALLSYSDSYPAHSKSIPKEWDRSTSPTVCSFKWPNSEGRKGDKEAARVSYAAVAE
jgi:hypothetical protein